MTGKTYKTIKDFIKDYPVVEEDKLTALQRVHILSNSISSISSIFKADSNVTNINPEHYKVGNLEVFDILEAKLSLEELIGFCKGNILKYTIRAEHKGGLEDFKKAQWYLNKLITLKKNE